MSLKKLIFKIKVKLGLVNVNYTNSFEDPDIHRWKTEERIKNLKRKK